METTSTRALQCKCAIPETFTQSLATIKVVACVRSQLKVAVHLRSIVELERTFHDKSTNEHYKPDGDPRSKECRRVNKKKRKIWGEKNTAVKISSDESSTRIAFLFVYFAFVYSFTCSFQVPRLIEEQFSVPVE